MDFKEKSFLAEGFESSTQIIVTLQISRLVVPATFWFDNAWPPHDIR